ncbi:U3 small nucleolar RNA-associated protein 7 Short=U3 snoRNA-associated protein 7; AltName: Full=U three protein 7 [Serendipita indica DSM 11827]|uniref:U three protein 7 n=1 Tax=Serendipita indica (strain DSM 11827) TaxID=1109443 RepID=G4TT20_SERID|nr:U3 small nucleolar RNA-associated protein 7 Short=U3 snoRNA-associated protein 7; AltName: Full=U three protein 7 [Serendipita indica DSM 11827]CCA74463.1 related to UTP7-U3 snoRNP protein [Serendipita indica DSM 11827]
MDSLIARADALGPPRKGKHNLKSQNGTKIKPENTAHDPTLASVSANTRVPKSLSNNLDTDVKERKKAARTGRYGHIQDLKLRAHLSKMDQGHKEWQEKMKDVEMLNVGESGGLQAEGELERTWKVTQAEIKSAVSLEDAQSRAEWKLDGGPYACRYSRNGRHVAIAGRKGHVATFDWQTATIHAELQLKETCRDITFLQDHTMFAVAQAKYVFMYDINGVELHRLSSHTEPTRLEYLPYHFLLTSVSQSGFLKYQDISTGQTIVEHRTKLGTCRTMCQNPWNAVIHLGHQNGTVTLWTPNSSTPHVRLLAHMGEVTGVAVDGSSSGRYMATSGADGRVKVWDCRNWKGCLRQWNVRTHPTSGVRGAQLDWSQNGMLAVGSASGVNIFKQPVITSYHAPLANPPLYMTHPTPRSHIASLRFVPHRDLLAVSHSSTSTSPGAVSHDHFISTIIIPGSGNPNYDTTEGGDPNEGGKGRREREVRSLLEKLEPGTITMDPEMLGGMREASKVDETLVHRKQSRLQRLKETGKADESEVPGDEEAEDEENASGPLDKKRKKKMRGKDRSMKRYLRKKRKNVIDVATVSIRAKLDKQRQEIKKARESAAKKAAGEDVTERKSALDRFKV